MNENGQVEDSLPFRRLIKKRVGLTGTRLVLATAPSNPLTGSLITLSLLRVWVSARFANAKAGGTREFTPSHRSGGTLFPVVSGFWFLPLGHGVPPCRHFTGRGAALSVAPCYLFLPCKANVCSLSFFFLIIVIPM
jgi:hypothetical protein